MRGRIPGTLVFVLAAALAAPAETTTLRDRLVAGTQLRYTLHVQHHLQVDYSRRLGYPIRGQDVNRKYEVSGVVAIQVAEAQADGSVRLEARFEELRLEKWLWGDDRAAAEQMIQTLLRQRMTVTRDAAGTVSLTSVERIPFDAFRPDIQNLESLAALPLLDVGSEGGVAPGSRWNRSIPPGRYRYQGESAPGTGIGTYEYVGTRTLANRLCALLASQTSVPLSKLQIPGQAEAAAQLARQGMSLRSSGEARGDRLELVEIEDGLLLGLHERASVFFRVTVRNELDDPQAKIPIPLMSYRFTGEREARWVGAEGSGLAAALAGSGSLEELRGGARTDAGGPSLGEIARELRVQREGSPEVVRPTPAPRAPSEEREVRHFPVNQAGPTAIEMVFFDPRQSKDGGGSLVVNAREAVVVPLYSVTDLEVENAQLVYQAWLQTENLVGQAYLEMWCVFEGVGEFFSRGVAQAVTGTRTWVRVETPFFLEKGQKPSRVQLNLVVNGHGRVWIDDIRLLVRPLR